MKKLIYIILSLLLDIPLFAQIGINTEIPDKSAALEITSPSGSNKGLLIPRMTTAQKTAVTSPAHSLLIYDTDKKCISQNLGTPSVPDWTCLSILSKKFFYMPSINIATTTLGTFAEDLYTQYKTEYGSPMYKSAGAPASIPNFPAATDLYYYVTHHDPARITINSINANGVMNYTTIKKANFDDYMNIVFVVK